MNICILGGGNIGTVLLGDLAARKKYTVNLFTRKPEIWSREIEVIDQENNTVIKSKIDKITDSPSILKEA